MADKFVVWLYFIFIVVCVCSLAEETQNLSGTDLVKGKWFTGNILRIFCYVRSDFVCKIVLNFFQMQKSKRKVSQTWFIMTPS